MVFDGQNYSIKIATSSHHKSMLNLNGDLHAD